MIGLSTRGSISLGCALVAGRNRVPSPAAGKTALRSFVMRASVVELLGFLYQGFLCQGFLYQGTALAVPIKSLVFVIPRGLQSPTNLLFPLFPRPVDLTQKPVTSRTVHCSSER